MFRSIRFYRLHSDWPASEEELAERLVSAAFRPCGPYAEQSSGWESVIGAEHEGPIARRVGGADLLRLRRQWRLLPTAAIEDALEARLDEYRTRTGEPPSRREKRRLRQQTRDDLLPKALTRSERTRGLILAADGLVAVDATAAPRAERFLEHLRAPLGSLEVAPLQFKRPFGDLLARIFLGDAPRGFVLGRECRMQDPTDTRATLRCTDMELADPAVRKHVRDGMRLTHVGVEYGNMLSCVIAHDGAIGKLKLLGADADEDAGDDPLAKLDAEIALLSGALRELATALANALGVEEGADRAA